MPPVPEDVIFYFDLATRGVVSKKTIVKEVKDFIKTKEKQNASCNWGVVSFLDDENPTFHESLAKDETEFDAFVQDNLKFTAKAHPLEQGIMLASTYLVEAFRTRDHLLRMIIISDGPTEGSNIALVQALMDLLENLKHFPVIIDVVRVGDQRIYPDDVKLSLITGTTGGQLHYAATDKEFKRIMETLRAAGMERGPGSPPEDARSFFEALCWDVVDRGDAGGTCISCRSVVAPGGVRMLACGNCGALFHDACFERHVQAARVCFDAICRCPSCSGLLRWSHPVPAEKPAPVSLRVKEPAPAEAPAPVSLRVQEPAPAEAPAPVSLQVKEPAPAEKPAPVSLRVKEPAPAEVPAPISLRVKEPAPAEVPAPISLRVKEPAPAGAPVEAPAPARGGEPATTSPAITFKPLVQDQGAPPSPAGITFKPLGGQAPPAPSDRGAPPDDVTIVSLEDAGKPTGPGTGSPPVSNDKQKPRFGKASKPGKPAGDDDDDIRIID